MKSLILLTILATTLLASNVQARSECVFQVEGASDSRSLGVYNDVDECVVANSYAQNGLSVIHTLIKELCAGQADDQLFNITIFLRDLEESYRYQTYSYSVELIEPYNTAPVDFQVQCFYHRYTTPTEE